MSPRSVLILLIALSTSGCCLYSARGYEGPCSDHFDGEAFFNPDLKAVERSPFALFGWLLTRERGPWSDAPVGTEPGPKPPERVGTGELRVTFVGHATVLIQMDGLNILTDPVWSDAVGPDGLTIQHRVRPPGIRFEDLPPIDVVLISHNHYDHLDLPTLRRLQKAWAPRIAAGLGTAELLRREGVRGARDFDWWDERKLSPQVKLTSVPVQHFSMRGACDRNRVLWTGFVLEGPAGKVYFGGDTGYGPHFAQVGERLGPFRLAILPIGAYRPRWFMSPVHVDPEEAVRAHRDLGAQTSLAIHYGTFKQADDGELEPIEDLASALDTRGMPPGAFWTLGFGEGRDVPSLAQGIARDARTPMPPPL